MGVHEPNCHPSSEYKYSYTPTIPIFSRRKPLSVFVVKADSHHAVMTAGERVKPANTSAQCGKSNPFLGLYFLPIFSFGQKPKMLFLDNHFRELKILSITSNCQLLQYLTFFSSTLIKKLIRCLCKVSIESVTITEFGHRGSHRHITYFGLSSSDSSLLSSQISMSVEYCSSRWNSI